jgi:hypothetical protein
MQCPGCHLDTPDNSTFCLHCGTRIATLATVRCPNCGQDTPGNSTFCLHCGARIATAATSPVLAAPAVAGWDYDDFVFKFKPHALQIKIMDYGQPGDTLSGAKQQMWELIQGQLLPEIQKVGDQGWEPIGEVGPAAILVRAARRYDFTPFGWAMVVLFAIGTWGLLLFFLPGMKGHYAEAVEFRVPMRCPKGLAAGGPITIQSVADAYNAASALRTSRSISRALVAPRAWPPLKLFGGFLVALGATLLLAAAVNHFIHGLVQGGQHLSTILGVPGVVALLAGIALLAIRQK